MRHAIFAAAAVLIVGGLFVTIALMRPLAPRTVVMESWSRGCVPATVTEAEASACCARPGWRTASVRPGLRRRAVALYGDRRLELQHPARYQGEAIDVVERTRNTAVRNGPGTRERL